MRVKNNGIIVLLFVLIFLVIGLFVYQNMYLKSAENKDKVIVYVATKDIPAGETLSASNIGALNVGKNQVLGGYVLDFAQINGKLASTVILKDEIILSQKVVEESDKNTTFKLNISMKDMSGLNVKDIVRVYVQIYNAKSKELADFLVLDSKEIITLNKNDKGVLTSVVVKVSDEEAINYYNAKKVGEIFIIRYNDLTGADKLYVTQFDINSKELADLGIDISAISKPDGSDVSTGVDTPPANGGSGGDTVNSETTSIFYTVKQGDTWESIAGTYNVTVDELKAANSGIETLSANIILVVNYKEAAQ